MMPNYSKTVCAGQCPGGEVEQPASGGVLYGKFLLDFVYVFEKLPICPQSLETSLCQVLNYYPTLAGRVANKNRATVNEDGHRVCKVLLNNRGVSFSVVTMAGSVQTVPTMEENVKRGVYCDIPDHRGVIAGDEPLMTVKLTLFENGGCSLGVVMSHLVADGWTFAMFMKDWSDIHNGLEIEPVEYRLPKSVFRMASHEETAEIVKSKNLQPTFCGWRGTLFFNVIFPLIIDTVANPTYTNRTVIHFTDEELQALKASAEASAGTWVSTNEALLAHIHSVMLDAFEMPQHKRQLGCVVPCNLRGKIDGCSVRTTGNLVSSPSVTYDLSANGALSVHNEMRKELSKKELEKTVALINHRFQHHQWYMNAETLRVGWLQQWNSQMTSPTYNVDFGAGPPDRAIPWAVEPVKVMKGPRGGVDVVISHFHAQEWAYTAEWHSKAPLLIRSYAALHGWLGLGALALVVRMFRKKNRNSKVRQFFLHVGILLSFLLQRLVQKAHQRKTSACFAAIKNHPRLRSFMQGSVSLDS